MKSMSFILTILLAAACSSSKKPEILTPQQFYDQMTTNNIQVLDIRSEQDYEKEHIKGAVHINIDDKNFEHSASNLYKDVPLYVYCNKGVRSTDAARRLRALGFKEVVELKGGLNEWTSVGLPVEVPGVKDEELPFQEAIKGDKLVLVDFNATWCGPCKMMQPFVDKIHMDRKSEVTVFSIDTDQERQLAQQYEITQLPTVMLFKSGKILDRKIGYMDAETLNGLVDKYK